MVLEKNRKKWKLTSKCVTVLFVDHNYVVLQTWTNNFPSWVYFCFYPLFHLGDMVRKYCQIWGVWKNTNGWNVHIGEIVYRIGGSNLWHTMSEYCNFSVWAGMTCLGGGLALGGLLVWKSVCGRWLLNVSVMIFFCKFGEPIPEVQRIFLTKYIRFFVGFYFNCLTLMSPKSVCRSAPSIYLYNGKLMKSVLIRYKKELFCIMVARK